MMEKIVEKYKESIDTRCCCCTCNLKFCIVWKIILFIFLLFKFFILGFYIFYFRNKNSNYYDEIIDNWSSHPIKKIERHQSTNFKSNNIGILNGVKKNYYIHSLYGVNLRFIYDNKYDYGSYFDDHSGHYLYYNEELYVVSLSIIDEKNINDKYYDVKIPLNEKKYLVYNLGRIGFYVQSKFEATESKCENKIKQYKKDICSSLDNCNNGKKLLNKNKCLSDNIDDFYKKIGELDLDDFIEENDINLKNEQYVNNTKVNFLMRGYIKLNESDPCIKNLTKFYNYINVKSEKKALDIVIYIYTIVIFILTIIVEIGVIKSKEGDLSDDAEKVVGFCLAFYFVLLVGFSINTIISFNNVDLIYRDFDECIIPNLKKDFKFSKFKKFVMKKYPIVLSIIALQEIVDKFSAFFRLCGVACRSCR